MNLKASRNYQISILHLCVIVILLVFTLHNLESLKTVTILNDEFGYWSNAALIVKRPWQSLAQHTPYYCFGYSVLLVPLFFLFNNTSTMYQTAILLNSIMMIGEYFFAFGLIRKIAAEINDILKIVIAFSSVFLCTNIFYSQVAWSECFFAFMMWFLVFCLAKLESKGSCQWLMMASVAMIVLFITHQRARGLFIPFVISAVWALKEKHKKLLWYCIPVLVVVTAYSLQRYVSKFQLNLLDNYRVTNLNELVVGNSTVSVYYEKIVAQFQSLLISLCGKAGVLLFSTFGLALVLIFYWCYTAINLYKKKTSRPTLFVTETFVVLSMLIMLVLQSVQIMDGPRKDLVVYSRYFDFVFGPVILFSMPKLLRNRSHVIVTIGLLLSTVSLFLVDKLSWVKSTEFFNVPCSPFIGGIECWFGGISSVAFVVLWISIVVLICIYSLSRGDKRFFLYVFCLLAIVINLGASYYANGWLNNARESFEQNTYDLLSLVNEHPDASGIVYLCDVETDIYCTDMKFLQFMLDKKEILVKDDEKDLLGMTDYILIVRNNAVDEYDLLQEDNIELIGSTSNYTVYSVL